VEAALGTIADVLKIDMGDGNKDGRPGIAEGS
jgi:hypothetical protein